MVAGWRHTTTVLTCLKRHYYWVQYTAIAPVINVGGTLYADTKSLLFSTRGAENPEISGRSRTAALSEAQKIIQLFQTLLIMIRPVSFFYAKNPRLLPSIEKSSKSWRCYISPRRNAPPWREHNRSSVLRTC